MKKPKWLTIPSLGIDLTLAGAFLTALVIFIYKNKPTAAEAGYTIWSPGVQRDQQMLIIQGALIWVSYCVLFSVILKRSLGQLLTGIYYEKNTGFLKRTLFIWL